MENKIRKSSILLRSHCSVLIFTSLIPIVLEVTSFPLFVVGFAADNPIVFVSLVHQFLFLYQSPFGHVSIQKLLYVQKVGMYRSIGEGGVC